ncbi:S-protein homolog 5-like [Ricinus communis]|uniref:S-protein homolog n=1 Tax=Ricinus communis TaxID=3988 RepID=B9SD51_RICCO|nr:S-protein homolog 5-like [Ricinus communis]EEF38489.1 conserved hypothetical protein [Ricinus communis]
MSASTIQNQKHCFLILILLVLLMTSEGIRTVHINIINNFGVDLTVHCKSKDDDLGAHLLHDQEAYRFGFKPNYWGNTLFYCSFAWTGEVKWFDIYVDERDYGRCLDCKWRVDENGPCFLDNDTGEVNKCYQWN